MAIVGPAVAVRAGMGQEGLRYTAESGSRSAPVRISICSKRPIISPFKHVPEEMGAKGKRRRPP